MNIRVALLWLMIGLLTTGCSGGGCGGSKSGADSSTAQEGQPLSGLPVTTVRIFPDGASYEVSAEVVTTPEDQATGMMYRTELDENAGMLFVFDSQRYLSFWMKNTLIPLDMIFINSDKEIVDINHNATPRSTNSFAAAAPALYVLEVNGGYCTERNIQIGDRVDITGY